MTQARSEVITLGGGCFWCLDAIYRNVNGVTKVTSGYSGGNLINPSYEQVCSGETGYVEVVQIEYNPQIVTTRQILEIFFTIHNPTTLNRQGNDIGTQYRSVIFYHSNVQQQLACEIITEITVQVLWENPIITKIEPIDVFYPAEEYHQNYFSRNLSQSYCQVIIKPKVAKLRSKYYNLLKKPI